MAGWGGGTGGAVRAIFPQGRRARGRVLVPQEWTEPNSFNVCVAPYKHFFRGYASFTRVRWRCLVIDEMQRVKGMTERHWEAVFTLKRWDPPPLPPQGSGREAGDG